MKLCTETITVFNSKYDNEDGYDVYVGTVIKGASWHCEIASTIDMQGLKAANKFVVRIPMNADFSGKSFSDPLTFGKIPFISPGHEMHPMIVLYPNSGFGDISTVFTLKNGDIIVKGEVVESVIRPSDLHKKYEAFTVLGVSENNRGRAQHWKVVGS